MLEAMKSIPLLLFLIFFLCEICIGIHFSRLTFYYLLATHFSDRTGAVCACWKSKYSFP